MSHTELSWFFMLTILAKVMLEFGTLVTKCLVSFGNTYLLKKLKIKAVGDFKSVKPNFDLIYDLTKMIIVARV